MKHVMLDLETLSIKPNAAIIAIAAARFDPLTGEIGERFYLVIDPGSYTHDRGQFHVDAVTALWWVRQSIEARSAISCSSSCFILDALQEFTVFFKKVPDSILWSHEDADRIWLKNAYDVFTMAAPWYYRNVASLRTLPATCDILGITRPDVPGDDLTKHRADSDVTFQIRQVAAYMDALRGVTP